MKIQMLGICRFSLLSEGGYKKFHDDFEGRRRHLYSDARLEERFFWFEHVALPAWRAQTDPDFQLVIVTGEDFPEPALERLYDLTSDMPQIFLQLMPPRQHRDVCREAMLAHADPDVDRLVLFRHDDDDAVSVDYVARTRDDIRRMGQMARDLPLFFLDYAKGFTLETVDGKVNLNPQITQNLGVALNVVAMPGHAKGALDYPHHRISAFMPGMCLTDTAMYMRGKHDTNDSDAPSRAGTPFRVRPGTEDALVAERFAVDLPAFRQAVARGRTH